MLIVIFYICTTLLGVRRNRWIVRLMGETLDGTSILESTSPTANSSSVKNRQEYGPNHPRACVWLVWLGPMRSTLSACWLVTCELVTMPRWRLWEENPKSKIHNKPRVQTRLTYIFILDLYFVDIYFVRCHVIVQNTNPKCRRAA